MNFIKNLFKQEIASTDLLKGAVEVHCHLLPGVDDGVQVADESVQTLTWMRDAGYKKVFMTPHVMTDWGKNNYTSLTEQFEKFKSLAPTGIEVALAAEYMMDIHFDDRMDEPFLSYNGKHILMETSYQAASPFMERQVYDVQMKGMIPIFAHPERYEYLKTSDYEEIKKSGLLFQLNLMSLCGAYGSRAEEKAKFLLKKGMYNFVGTDTHRFNWLKNCMERLRLSKDEVKNLQYLFDANNALCD